MKALFKILAITLFCSTFLQVKAKESLFAWKFKGNAAFHSTPLIDDTVIFIGCLDKNFYAINKKTGEKIWQFSAAYEINSKAAVNDSLVFFESGFKLFALDKKTGKQVWSWVASASAPEMSVGYTDYHHSSPLIYKDKVYYGDGWGNINGVDIKTGAIAFQFNTKADSGQAIRSTPAIQNDTIFFGDWGGHVYAVSLLDSSLIWKYTLQKRRDYYGMVTSEMIIRDTLLYFGSQHDVFQPLSIKTGKPAWTFIDPKATYLPSTPVFYKNSVIIGSTINTFKVYSLTNGNINWTVNSDGIFFVHPEIVDSVIIMNTSNFGGNGTIFMINGNNGSLMREYHFTNAAPASPVYNDNKLFVGNGDGYLYAFNFNELLFPKEDTSVFFDTTSVKVVLGKGEATKKFPIAVENYANTCDSFFVSYEVKGNPAAKGIVVPATKKGHVWANAKTTVYYLAVNPAILDLGSYSVDFSIYSKRHPELVFQKTYSIEITEGVHVKQPESHKAMAYPNPAKNSVNFSIENSNDNKVQLSVYAMNGALVYSYAGNVTEGNLVWNTMDLAGNACKAGLYVYKIISGNINYSGTLSLLGKD